jgi:hypothetical protein
MLAEIWLEGVFVMIWFVPCAADNFNLHKPKPRYSIIFELTSVMLEPKLSRRNSFHKNANGNVSFLKKEEYLF